ncbi:putative ribonuclease H-like domain-containing protein [Tanacetum coccineum]
MGHFARECRVPRNKEGQFKYQDNTRKQGNNEDTSLKVMLAIDGVGFDWSDMAKEQVQTNMALMAFSDFEVYNDKTCVKNYETLKKQCDDLIVKLNQTEFIVATYKRGLTIVEEQLITYRKNEILFSEEVAVLKREVACKDYEINVLKSEFKKVKQEKEGIDFKIEKFDKALKDLDKLLGSQITDKSKKSLGYNVVPPPYPLIYSRPKKLDLSYSGLDEFKSYGSEESKQESNIVCDKKLDASKENSDDSLIKEDKYTRVNLRRCIYSERIKSVQDCIYCCQFGKFASYFAFIFQGVGKVKPKSANDDQKQTRRKTKSTSEQGFLSAIYEEKTHDTLNTCLYACFLSKIEPTSIAKALSDSSLVEAKQEELLQFKLQQGHRQEEGIDYEEVFAPVARIEAIRLFLAYDSFMGFMVYQMDVKSAFLYGTIEGSLRESQRFMLSTHQDLKIALNLPDKYIVYQKQKGYILLVQVYVDDIIFGSTNKELCTAFEKLMKDKFQMSSMGELTFFLGLQVTQKEDGIFISQDKYVAEILKKFNYTDVKSASTPVDLEKPLVKDGDADDVDVHLYRSMIGSLMYLTRLGKQMRPLLYFRDSLFELVLILDSDNACKKQTVVATSTAESEYVAAAS